MDAWDKHRKMGPDESLQILQKDLHVINRGKTKLYDCWLRAGDPRDTVVVGPNGEIRWVKFCGNDIIRIIPESEPEKRINDIAISETEEVPFVWQYRAMIRPEMGEAYKPIPKGTWQGEVWKIFSNFPAALAIGGGYALGQRWRRPDEFNSNTNISQQGGGASSSSSSSADAEGGQGGLGGQGGVGGQGGAGGIGGGSSSGGSSASAAGGGGGSSTPSGGPAGGAPSTGSSGGSPSGGAPSSGSGGGAPSGGAGVGGPAGGGPSAF